MSFQKSAAIAKVVSRDILAALDLPLDPRWLKATLRVQKDRYGLRSLAHKKEREMKT